jgi:PAS domain S-box-containing protein
MSNLITTGVPGQPPASATRRVTILFAALAALATGLLAGAEYVFHFDLTAQAALAAFVAGLAGLAVGYSREQRETARRTEALYRMIVETSLEGICIADANGTLMFANRRLGEMLGVDPAALRGRSLFDYILEVQGTATYMDAPLAAQQEVQMESADGRRLDVLCSSTSLQPGGSFSGMVIMLTDITERVAARQALEHAYGVLRERVVSMEGVEQEATDRHEARIEELAAHLAAANTELEAFSYSVSHDLQAPLRGVAGFSRELLRAHCEQLDERGRHYVSRIQAGADRMLQLIADLLRLSKVSRSAMTRTPVDMTAVAASVAHELRETGGSHVTVDVAPGLTAQADERLLRIIFANLIGNAMKFSAGGAEPRVEIGVAPDGAFFVRDNGVGFDGALAQKIFLPFQRLQTDFEGSGIGLAIVQRIINRHAGSIWAQSSRGQGATFFFTLGSPATNLHPESTP